jgi:hypothetical protein
MRNTALSRDYFAILSTQATGGGAHMSHIGSFKVFARVQTPTTNSGDVTLAWEWGEGDFQRYSRNTATTIDQVKQGTWQIVDLGSVSLTKTTSGTQQWEGRLLAKSDQGGDDIDVDWLMLVPVDEGYGEASAIERFGTPSTFSIRDDFIGTTSGGSLNARALPTGTGSWTTSGATTDYTFADNSEATDGEVVQRATTSDVGFRFARAGSATFTRMDASLRFKMDSATGGALSGMLLKYVDANNFAGIYITRASSNHVSVTLYTYVATVPYTLTLDADSFGSSSWPWVNLYVRLVADGTIRYWLTVDDSASTLDGQTVFSSDDAVGFGGVVRSELASGGALAAGTVGIFDSNIGATANTRRFDNFRVWVPGKDAAMFATQSIEVRSDRVVRENAAGTLWTTVSRYVGDYLRVPPAGSEGRTSRLILKASRGVPGEGNDSGIDDVSARLLVTPRYLEVPEA